MKPPTTAFQFENNEQTNTFTANWVESSSTLTSAPGSQEQCGFQLSNVFSSFQFIQFNTILQLQQLQHKKSSQELSN